MSDRPDPDKIFQAMLADPDFTEGQTSNTLAVFETFARALPDLLADHHDQTLTFTTLTAARIALIQRFADTGYLAKLVEVMPVEQLGSMSVPEAVRTYIAQIPRIIARYTEDLEVVQAGLAQQAVTEELLLENPNGGRLNADAMAAYRAGSFTVGKLFEIQPGALFTKS